MYHNCPPQAVSTLLKKAREEPAKPFLKNLLEDFTAAKTPGTCELCGLQNETWHFSRPIKLPSICLNSRQEALCNHADVTEICLDCLHYTQLYYTSLEGESKPNDLIKFITCWRVTEYWRFREIRPSKQRGLYTAVDPKVEKYSDYNMFTLFSTLQTVFSIDEDWLKLLFWSSKPSEQNPPVWNVKTLESQKRLLPLLEKLLAGYRKKIGLDTEISKNSRLSALMSIGAPNLTEKDVVFQMKWIKRWIRALKKEYYFGYVRQPA